jgi:hypothetical protein
MENFLGFQNIAKLWRFGQTSKVSKFLPKLWRFGQTSKVLIRLST